MSSEESDSVNEAVPVSTKYKNYVTVFAEWLRLREVQVAVSLDGGGLFKDRKLHKVQTMLKWAALLLLGVQIRFNPLPWKPIGFDTS